MTAVIRQSLPKLPESIVSVAMLAATWEGAAYIWQSPLFPPLERVFPALASMELSGELNRHMAVSLRNVAAGFALAVLFGLLAGCLAHLSPGLKQAIVPLADFMRPISALALFPILLLLFGLAFWSKVAVIFWSAWPSVLFSMLVGLAHVERDITEAAQLDGAGRLSILFGVTFPLALPAIMAGVRIAAGSSWLALVAAEMLGSSSGLGYAILSASQAFAFPEMYAYILTVGLLGMAMNQALEALQAQLERIYGF